jgi:hypothetical protein
MKYLFKQKSLSKVFCTILPKFNTLPKHLTVFTTPDSQYNKPIFPNKLLEEYYMDDSTITKKDKSERKLITELSTDPQPDYLAMSEASRKNYPLPYLLGLLQNTLSAKEFNKDQILTILKFINYIIYEHNEAVGEEMIASALQNVLAKIGTLIHEEDQGIIIEIHYELILLKDKVSYVGRDDLAKLVDKYMSLNKTFFIILNRPIQAIIEKDRLYEFYRYIYVLARISTDNVQQMLTTSNYNSLGVYVKTKVLPEMVQKFTPEKLIVLLISLKKLGLINESNLREINIENFRLEHFHIFLSLLGGDVPVNNFENGVLNIMLFDFLKHHNDMTVLLPMRDTIDYIFKICYSGVTSQNYTGVKQRTLSRVINTFFNKVTNTVVEIVEKEGGNDDFLIWVAYIFSAYSAKPTHAYNLICKKNIDIKAVNPEILMKFITSVEDRLMYCYQYDHEVYLLKRLHKQTYVPYDANLDEIITKLTHQIVDIMNRGEELSKELILTVLKTMNIIFHCDSNDVRYKLPPFMADACSVILKTCIARGGKYLKQVLDDEDILLRLVNLLQYIKFYTEGSKQVIEDFLLFLAGRKQNTQDLRFSLNISEYITLDILNPTTNKEYSKTFMDIAKKLADNTLTIIVKDKKLDTKLMSNKLGQYDYIRFLVNIYNILLLRSDIYKEAIKLFNNFFEEINGLRVLYSYHLLKLKQEAICPNTLIQVISNFQTLQIFNKNNLLMHILTVKNLKEYTNHVISVLKSLNRQLDEFNMSSLSYLISTIFDEFTHKEIADILKVLGNKKEHNYHPIFEKKLFEKYSNRELLFNLKKKEESVFFSLALNWPFFIQNEELVRCLLHSHESKLLQMDRYEIVNLITYNMIMHRSLLDYFGQSIGKIKNLTGRKEILCNYINNCTHIGLKMESGLYELMLGQYEELLNKGFTFSLDEMVDLVALSYISDLDNGRLTSLGKAIYNQLIERVKMSVDMNLIHNFKGTSINYYPSITSEDRIFHKSLINTFIRDEHIEYEHPAEGSEETGTGMKSYMRKSRDSKINEDKAFEEYFEKKRELIYGHEATLMNSITTRNTLKRYCVTKLLGLKTDDSFNKEVHHILNTFHETNRESELYQKLYVKFISESFSHKYKILTKYKDGTSGIIVDFALTQHGKAMYVLYISDQNVSKEHLEGSVEIDGLYKLLSKTLEKGDVKVVYIYENSLKEYGEGEFNKLITDNLS